MSGGMEIDKATDNMLRYMRSVSKARLLQNFEMVDDIKNGKINLLEFEQVLSDAQLRERYLK